MKRDLDRISKDTFDLLVVGGGIHGARGRIIAASEMRDLFPFLHVGDSTSGALWYDAQVQDSERLTLSVLLAAADRGAALANYAVVQHLLVEDDAEAINLVVRRPPLGAALGLQSSHAGDSDPGGSGGRFLFLVPWRNRTLIGTWYPRCEPQAGAGHGTGRRYSGRAGSPRSGRSVQPGMSRAGALARRRNMVSSRISSTRA